MRNLILITGSSGLLGSRLMSVLRRDYDVVGLDVVQPDTLPDGATFTKCDLTDDASVSRALDSVRTTHGDHIASVIHLAAYYDFSGEPSPLYQKLTVEGTQRLLKHLHAFEKVEQLIFSSTHLVMKPSQQGEPINEDSPLEGTWDYPESKIETEKLLHEEHGEIPVTILRLAGVYDEYGRSPGITEHVDRIYNRELTSYFFPGNAEHGQAYVHIDDAISAFALAVEHRRELADEEVFLIAEPSVVPYGELQDIIGSQLHGRDWPTIRIPKPVAKAGAWVRDELGEDEAFIKPWMIDLADAHYPIDVSKAAGKLGWKPTHRLRTTLPVILQRLLDDPRHWYEINGIEPPESLSESAGGSA